jgi:hypothetical protein
MHFPALRRPYLPHKVLLLRHFVVSGLGVCFYSKNRHSNIIEIARRIFKVRLNSRFVMGAGDFSFILGG